MTVEAFFAYARERHSVYLRRQNGLPMPWTDDPILQKYRFTNVYRELDRTTVWLRKNVTEVIRASNILNDKPERILMATILYRALNRITSGEVIFNQPDFDQKTPWDYFYETGDTTEIIARLRTTYPTGPYVTGAYMIRSPTGMPKLEGVLENVQNFYQRSRWRTVARALHAGSQDMRAFTRWLSDTPGHGPFLAYEVTCDLRYSGLLDKAEDRFTWANVGPGALRGLTRIRGVPQENPRRAKNKWRINIPDEQAQAEMRVILELSRNVDYWPQNDPAWPAWEMREVEHTLCEFDKHSRVRLGEGTPRGRFA